MSDGFVADVGHALVKAGHAPSAAMGSGRGPKKLPSQAVAVPSECYRGPRLDVDATGAQLSTIWRAGGARGPPGTLAALLPHTTPPAELERLAQAAFESWRVKRLLVAPPAFMACVAVGRTTATVVDVGAAETRAVPVVDGVVQRSGIVCAPVGGDDVAAALCRAVAPRLCRAVAPRLPSLPQAAPHHTLAPAALKAAVELFLRQPTLASAESVGSDDEDAPKPPAAADDDDDEVPVGLRLPDGTALRVGVPAASWRHANDVLFEAGGVATVAQLALRRVALSGPGAATDVLLMGGPTLGTGFERRFVDAVTTAAPVEPLRAVDVGGAGDPLQLSPMHPTSLAANASTAHALLGRPGDVPSVRYHPLRDRLMGAWAGGSIALQLPSIAAVAMGADAYKEQGPRAILRSVIG